MMVFLSVGVSDPVLHEAEVGRGDRMLEHIEMPSGLRDRVPSLVGFVTWEMRNARKPL